MSLSARISFDWADGESTFRLGVGELLELQEKCDAGPAQIVARLEDGTWRVQDLRETLRLGLIGGGMTPTDAMVKVRRYVDARPLMESVDPARAVLLAALLGFGDRPGDGDQAGETAAETTTSEAMDASSPRPSTAPPPSSASAPATSTP